MKKLVCLVLFFSSVGILASDRGYTIAKSVDDANSGFKTEKALMKMILITPSGKIERVMESLTEEDSDTQTNTLLEFKLPKDVRGTKLLTHSFDKKDDSQWIYLSAFKRVKRISSSSKMSSFMGSEFTFEDLRAVGIDKFTYKFLREKNTGNDIHLTYEKVSKEKSGYSKQVVTISQKKMNPILINYFDRSGELMKIATFKDYEQISFNKKSFWRPKSIHMKNVQTNKESIMEWESRSLGKPIPAKYFKKSSLK